jgi:hypothetical protein
VILYELLSGKRPFSGDTATAILYMIIHDPAPPLDPTIVGGAPDLQRVLDRALAKDAEARYATAALMAEELAAVVNRLRGPATPPAEVLEAVNVSRRLLKEGKIEDAVRRLSDATLHHPTSIEARRALRTATRELQRKQKPPEPALDDYPELDATFQAAPTRLSANTVLARSGQVPAGSGSAPAPAAAPVPASGGSARLLLGAAAAALVVAVIAGGLLLARGRGSGSAITLRVRSDPAGARVFVDGRDTGVTTDGELTLPTARSGTVVLAFRKPDYREVSRTLRLPVTGGEVRVSLEPVGPTATASVPSKAPTTVALSIPVVTDPPGAAVTVDGAPVAGVTPLTVSVDPAREHRIAVRLDGHAPQETRVEAGAGSREVRFALEPVGPPGRVAISAPYPLDVVWRGKVLSHGQPSPEVNLPAGRQQLTLVSPTYFLRLNVNVDVRPPAVAGLSAPALGKINIRANPDNCQVFIDGNFVEYPPILDRAIVVGEHKVGFKWPDGSHQEESVEVARGGPAYVTGRKD